MANLLTRLKVAAQVIRQGPFGLDSEAVAMLFPNFNTLPPKRGTRQTLKAYNEMPWLRAVAHRVSTAVGSVRWRVFAVRPVGSRRFVRDRVLQRAGGAERAHLLARRRQAGELFEVEDHPLLSLLQAPNASFTGTKHRQLTQIHLDLVGEAFWFLERNEMLGVPERVFAMPPNWVTTLPGPRSPFFTLQIGADVHEVPERDMIYFRDPDPANPFGRGSGLAMTLGDELETDEYAAKHTKQWFLNNAIPPMVITQEGAREADIRRLETNWRHQNLGFWRSFKPYFTNKKIDVKELSHSFREMQLIALREHERNTIIQVFGQPPELLGIIESSNRATIESADFIMAKHVTVPRLEFLRETMQIRLVPEFDERIVLDYVSPIEADKDHELKVAEAQPAVLMVDEWREMQGREPLPDERGRVFLSPLNLVASTEPGGALASSLAPAGNGDRAHLSPFGSGPGRRPSSLVAGAKQADVDFLSLVQGIARRLEPAWRDAFLSAMEAVRREIGLTALEEALRSANPEAVLRVLPLARIAAEFGDPTRVPALMEATLGAAAEAANEELLSSLGIEITFTATNPRSVSWIQRHAAELVREIDGTSRLAVREIIERAFVEAIAPRNAARLIRDVVGLTSRQATAVANFRARLIGQGVAEAVADSRTARFAAAQLRRRALAIARTETIRASNAGQQLLWEEGISTGQLNAKRSRKFWIVTPDDRLDEVVCEPMPFMAENADVLVDGLFTTGAGNQVSTPPAHPLCRCAMGLRFV